MIKPILITAFILGMFPVEQNENLKAGKYKGSFTADGRHALITELTLKSNGKFKETRTITSITKTYSSGTWRIYGDTLKLFYNRIKDTRRDTTIHCHDIKNPFEKCETGYFFINQNKLYYFKRDDGSYSIELQ